MAKITAIAMGLFLLTSCAANKLDGAGDAEIGDVKDPHWIIFNAPDHYGNVAFACNGTTGMYEPRTTDSASNRTLQLVPNDPLCQGPVK